MELENLKSQFNSLESSQISKEALLGMVNVNGHPVLRGIRIQMIIESTAWILFLGFYYNFFDGHLKPIFWNLALIISVALMLVHNSLNYQVTNNPISGENLVSSLVTYLKRLKKYAYLSIGSRTLALTAIFGFFLSGIETFEQRHYASTFVLVAFVAAQAFILWRIWHKRIQTIRSKYEQLAEKN
ncbi:MULTISPECIES: hypothetical protein [Reichenbachiella]|uniref:hypothetical protein n=1 Tax=Reichenbachiella TaxID=156993 RepID=UPI000E6CF359|nr:MULTISPECIES: hypothetical protein [Reichenbachiella]MBU2912917.1 hypothetical protein [Reichenbachiella agariperforans]RJE72776.1 hypothetical protein BGP76_02130 [Reichenbachiella sp. MSK19-1]